MPRITASSFLPVWHLKFSLEAQFVPSSSFTSSGRTLSAAPLASSLQLKGRDPWTNRRNASTTPQSEQLPSLVSPDREQNLIRSHLKEGKSMNIGDILPRDGKNQPSSWVRVSSEESVGTAASILLKRKLRSLIVVKDNNVVGIVGQKEFVHKLYPKAFLSNTNVVKEIMSTDIMCVEPSNALMGTMASMIKRDVRHVAVVRGEVSRKAGSVVPTEAVSCVLSIKDLLRALKTSTNEKLTCQKNDPVEAELLTKSTLTRSHGAERKEGHTTDITVMQLLKQKHSTIKIILNAREGDNVTAVQALQSMRKHGFGSVLVLDRLGSSLRGIFCERDFLKEMYHCGVDIDTIMIEKIMTKKVQTVEPSDSLNHCIDLMASGDFHHLPVVQADKLLGVLSMKDIVEELSKDHLEKSKSFWLFDYFRQSPESG